MTKLKRCIAAAAQKRSRKKGVERRRDKRTKDAEEKKVKLQEERVAAEVAMEEAAADGDNKKLRDAMRRAGDLVIEIGGGKAKSKRQLTRKQMVRKKKGQDRGAVMTDTYRKKAVDKTHRVHHRAVVRNSELDD
jgi:hypothetical protein